MTDASTHAIIEAEYADYRRVKGRKVIQLVCEVPLERAADIHKRLGEPGAHDKQIWVAIALLNEKPATGQAKEKRRFEDMKPSQQAGMLCQDAIFWEFLAFYTGGVEASEDGAAQCVRDICNVGSRSALDADPEGKATWRGIVKRFHDWKSTDKRYTGTPTMERR